MEKDNTLSIVITVVKEQCIKKFKFILTEEKYNIILERLEDNNKYIKIGPLILLKDNIFSIEEIRVRR